MHITNLYQHAYTAHIARCRNSNAKPLTWLQFLSTCLAIEAVRGVA